LEEYPLVNGHSDNDPGELDHVLMERICADDEEALNQLMERYWEPLVGYARSFVGTTDAAEDKVQDSFIRLWENRTRWTPSGSPRRYLYTVARNLCLNERDRKRVRKNWAAQEEHKRRSNPTPADLLDQREIVEALQQCVATLPPRRREVFDLVYLHGLTYREVSAVMGIAVPTVANQASAALETVRGALSAVTDRKI
jgi:RNA polymerase sigma-70 factor (family 1)